MYPWHATFHMGIVHFICLLYTSLAALEKDASRVVSYIEEDILTVPIKSTVGLRLDLNEVLERYITADLKEMNLNNLVTDFFYILRKHNLKFPAHFVSILRALVVAEGTGMMLNPHFTICLLYTSRCV